MQIKSVDTDGIFEGYASLFGKEDLGKDMVMPGAFRDSLKKRGVSGVKMLYQHDPYEPLGIWLDIREDMKGLYVKGQLMTDVTRAREVLSLMQAGALDGLSIGFRTVEGIRDPKTGLRQLKKIDLWEISIVTFPMLVDARIRVVKANAKAKSYRLVRIIQQASKAIKRDCINRLWSVPKAVLH